MTELVSQAFMQQDSLWLTIHARLGISYMDHLYNRFDGAFPHKWRSNFKDEQSIENWRLTWSSQFDAIGLTFEEVRRGLEVCERSLDWPPSLSEFVRACRPALNAEQAFHEAVQGLAKRDLGEDFAYSSPAIYWASVELGFELRCMTFAQLAPRWKIALDYQVSLGQWEKIESAKKQLGFQKQVTASGLEHAEKARQSFKRADDAIDYLAWARKIMQRLQAGDRSVPLQVEKNAREALGL